MSKRLEQLSDEATQAFAARDYDSALDLFRIILQERPAFADVRHSAGMCLAFLGRQEEALEQFDLALQVNPAYVEAHLSRALLLQELGRYEDAGAAFERARRHEQQGKGRFPTAISARLANAHAAVGDLYREAGATADAAGQYLAALELRPRYDDIRNKYASALLEQGRTDEAAEELTRILDSNPRFLAARLNLGLVRLRQGRHREAAMEWRVCQQQNPGNPQARAFMTMLENADAGEVRE
jgi:tetratricopeptide (TPR) repeat protein